MPVVIESSSVVLLLEPVAVVLVVRIPMREMKPATERILDRITDLMVNAPADATSPDVCMDQLRAAFPSLQPRHTWTANLIDEGPPAALMLRLQDLVR